MGFNWKAFYDVVKVIAPAALAASGVPAPLVPLTISLMQEAESSITAKGAEKKAHVVKGAVDTAHLLNETHPNGPIINVGELETALDKGIDAAVAATNVRIKKN